MKIVVISDTHGQECNIKIPKCDIFMHCGDSYINSLLRLNIVNEWLGTIEADHRIIIAGNHDTELELIGQAWCEHLFTNAMYLQDKEVTIEGLKIYGSPWTPLFMSWAFMKPRGSYELRKLWKQIPENLDILITHGMPYKILDHSNYQHEDVGCKILRNAIFRKRPKIYVGGHIHEAHGHLEKDGINFYNCSVLNEHYKLVNKPVILEI